MGNNQNKETINSILKHSSSEVKNKKKIEYYFKIEENEVEENDEKENDEKENDDFDFFLKN